MWVLTRNEKGALVRVVLPLRTQFSLFPFFFSFSSFSSFVSQFKQRHTASLGMENGGVKTMIIGLLSIF
jgi:hypothetical protein